MLSKKVVLNIITLIAIFITSSASIWQIKRAFYKINMEREFMQQQQMSPLKIKNLVDITLSEINRKIIVNGFFYNDKTILIDNVIKKNSVGFNVVTPLRVENTNDYILINRGWVKKNFDKDIDIHAFHEKTKVKISGVLRKINKNFIELSEETVAGNLWQNLSVERYQSMMGLNISSFIILQDDQINDGLLRFNEGVKFGTETHIMYAGQWLIFTILIIFFYFYYGNKKEKKS